MIGREKKKKYDVFPAGAGVILTELQPLNQIIGFPRRCGGDP